MEALLSSPSAAIIGGSLLLMAVVYYGHGLAYAYLDLKHEPAALFRLKIQPKRGPSVEDLVKVVRNMGLNTVIVLIPVLILVSYLSSREIGVRVSPVPPPLLEVAGHLLCFTLIEDVLFYYVHAGLHAVPFLYRNVHKQHHEYKAPFALAAAYAHPVEGLLANVGPIAFGPVLMGSHILTMWIWMTLALITTQQHHGGYRFPWHVGDQPNFHDYHHETYTGNYGLLGLLDYTHQTDAAFQAAARAKEGGSGKIKTDGLRALPVRCVVWAAYMATIALTVTSLRHTVRV